MTIDIDDAVKRLADCAGCTEYEMIHSRRALPATFRQLLWELLYCNGMHPKEIAKAFEHDRTTILYGIRHANTITAKNGYGNERELFLTAMGLN